MKTPILETSTLTKKQKNKWLKAMKSGKYEQGFISLKRFNPETEKHCYCALGIFNEVCKIVKWEKALSDEYVYKELIKILGDRTLHNIFTKNDEEYKNIGYQKDFSNVIPLIENLKTID